MIAYKLIKIRKDGSIGSLFINASERYPTNTWIDAQGLKRKGFAFRKGWHCMAEPSAPHLKFNLASGENREFWVVEIEGVEEFSRPLSQGGKWYLAQKIRFIEKYEK